MSHNNDGTPRTDIKGIVQWGFEVGLANSVVHVFRGGPHMYYKLSTYYPTQDPVEAAMIVDSGATDVVLSCTVINRGNILKGNARSVMLQSPRVGLTIPIGETGIFLIASTRTNKDLLKLTNSGSRPLLSAVNSLDLVGYSDSYVTEKWRFTGSTGAASFAGGKFKIEGNKGYVGINADPSPGIAMLVRAADGGDRGLVVRRPSATANNRLVEFRDEQNVGQGQAFDAIGRPVAIGTPAVVTKGTQTNYAHRQVQTRDIAGSITAQIRPAPTAPGTIATVTFSQAYTEPPLFITIADHSRKAADLYVSSRSATSFTVSTRSPLTPGAIVNFDYSIIA